MSNNLPFSTKFVLVYTALTMSLAGWLVAILFFCGVITIEVWGWHTFFVVYGAIFTVLGLLYYALVRWSKANPTEQDLSRQRSQEILKEMKALREMRERHK